MKGESENDDREIEAEVDRFRDSLLTYTRPFRLLSFPFALQKAAKLSASEARKKKKER